MNSNNIPLVVSSVAFEKYFKLINDVFNTKVDAVLVCDSSGNAIWKKSSIDQIDVSCVIQFFSSEDNTNTDSFRVLELNNSKKLYAVQLGNDDDTTIGYLIVKVSLFALKNHEPDILTNMITSIAALISQEQALTNELNLMADELSNRYDELNLLYTTSSDSQDFSKLNQRLKHLLSNCVDFLNVDLAILFIPEKDISIHFSTPGDTNDTLSAEVDKLKNLIFTKLTINKKCVVINNNKDTADIYSDIGCKILASPMLDSENSVIGVLMIAKNNTGSDYSNSDRNLLKIMSLKVLSTIQENYDILTGLINRSGYEDKINEFLQLSRNQGSTHCILNIDIDNFRVINDTLSYQAGDQLIKNIALIIRENVPGTSIVARLGGDKYGVILDNCTLKEAIIISETIRLAVSAKYFIIEDQQIQTTISTGIAPITPESENLANLLSAVEVACSLAKDRGKNNEQTYQPENKDSISRKDEMKWVGIIQNALRENKFELYCQTIEPLKPGSEDYHFEILLRLRGNDNEIISPWSFIPAAERFYLMPEIDRWVISETIKLLSKYGSKLKNLRGKASINLSGQTISSKDFLDFVTAQFARSQVPASGICFEITESAAIAHLENAKYFMSELSSKGFEFSLDDFGTGLSSFAYLKTLKVDYLKIDGAFVKQILNDPIAEVMVAAINNVGHVMGLKTVAEFVENEEIKNHLTKMNIDFAQGYAIAKPIALERYLNDL